MNEAPFYKTRMGQQFINRTVPELVNAIQRLEAAVDRLAERLGAHDRDQQAE